MVAMLGAELGRRAALPVMVWNPGATDSQMGENVSPTLGAMLRPVRRCFFRTPAQAAAFGLGAAAGPRPAVGYLTDGDLGAPRAGTPPVPWDELGGDMCDGSPRRGTLWEEVEAALRQVLGQGALPADLPERPEAR